MSCDITTQEPKFGFIKAIAITILIPIFQVVFSMPLIIAEISTQQKKTELHVTNTQTQKTNAGYQVEFDVVQVGQPVQTQSTVTISTEAGNNILNIEIPQQQLTHYTTTIKDKPITVAIYNTPMTPLWYEFTSFTFLTPTNLMLTGTYAILVIAIMTTLSQYGYLAIFPIKTAPDSAYTAAARLAIGIQMMTAVLQIITSIITSKPPLSKTDTQVMEFITNAMANNKFIVLICVVIAAPIFEELLFRGYILGRLLKTKSPLSAIIASAILFSISHSGKLHIMHTLMTGLFLGYLYYKTRSILPCILAHFLNNAISFIMTKYTMNTTPASPILIVAWLNNPILLLALGTYLLYTGIQMLNPPQKATTI